MTKIDVKEDDEFSDIQLDTLYLYRTVMSLLADIKLSRSPTAVQYTLNHYPVVARFLRTYQDDAIIKLEGKIKTLGG